CRAAVVLEAYGYQSLALGTGRRRERQCAVRRDCRLHAEQGVVVVRHDEGNRLTALTGAGADGRRPTRNADRPGIVNDGNGGTLDERRRLVAGVDRQRYRRG